MKLDMARYRLDSVLDRVRYVLDKRIYFNLLYFLF